MANNTLTTSQIMANITSNIVWPLFTGFSVIMIIVAGFLFLTAEGDPAKLKTARNALIFAFIGIIIGIAAYSIPTLLQKALNGS